MRAFLAPDSAATSFVYTGPPDPKRAAVLLEPLSNEERARACRIAVDSARWIYLVAHALLQHEMAKLTGASPVGFQRGRFGRPELLEPFAEPRLRFNLTHTAGLVAVAVCRGHDIGLDAEAVGRGSPIHDLARRFFSAEEAGFIAEAPPPLDRARFFAVWTAKEAVVKALGAGLSMPLDSFCVRLDPLRVAFADPASPHASGWTLDHRDLPQHRLTLAVRSDSGATIATSFREISLDDLLDALSARS